MTDHKYRGELIERCEYATGESGHGRWRIVSHHGPTGMRMMDQGGAHYYTLAQARESIDDMLGTNVDVRA